MTQTLYCQDCGKPVQTRSARCGACYRARTGMQDRVYHHVKDAAPVGPVCVLCGRTCKVREIAITGACRDWRGCQERQGQAALARLTARGAAARGTGREE